VELQRRVLAVAGHLGLACDVLLFDTTSTYFETEDDDEFGKYGNSKDHRPAPSCARRTQHLDLPPRDQDHQGRNGRDQPPAQGKHLPWQLELHAPPTNHTPVTKSPGLFLRKH